MPVPWGPDKSSLSENKAQKGRTDFTLRKLPKYHKQLRENFSCLFINQMTHKLTDGPNAQKII